jgi:hypothetical protein
MGERYEMDVATGKVTARVKKSERTEASADAEDHR